MRPPTLPPPVSLLLAEKKGEELSSLYARYPAIGLAQNGRYRHWSKLQYITPPEGLSHRDWWLLVKLARIGVRRDVPLKDRRGWGFSYTLPDPLLAMLHNIDRGTSGHVEMPEDVTSPEHRDRYVISSLIEEAINSSQLEGAATTRSVAKEMIRTGRAPRTPDEQMILSNFRAMEHVRTRIEEPLSLHLVFDIHRTVTEGTMKGGEAALRQAGRDDDIGVYSGQTLLHKPPDADELRQRLQAMCAFANEEHADGFLHPVIRAIILHFWLAYDHPFIDGNGRTARALFYWAMLRQGLWLMEFISISPFLKQAPARYGRSFLYSETDDNDLTYFILHQLDVIERSMDAFHAYVRRKREEIKETRALLRPAAGLNHRQLALLTHALKHPGQRYTIQSHQTSHGVVYQTARTDLLGLQEKGLLDCHRVGKAFSFSVPANLRQRLDAL